MDILQAARVLQPGTAWTCTGDPNSPNSLLIQAADGTTRVAVPTPAQLAPVMASDTTPAAITAAQRATAISDMLTDPSAPSKLMRGVLLLIESELNILRQRDVDRSADVAAAISLADLQTRWALRAALTPRTPAQLETAIQAIENAGTAD